MARHDLSRACLQGSKALIVAGVSARGGNDQDGMPLRCGYIMTHHDLWGHMRSSPTWYSSIECQSVLYVEPIYWERPPTHGGEQNDVLQLPAR